MKKPVIFQFPINGLTKAEECRTNYMALQHQGCINEDVDESGEVHVRRAYEEQGEIPQYWAVYGQLPDGTHEWIADFRNELHSWFFTATLARALGVPVEGKVFNVAPLEAACYMMNVQGSTH